MRLKALLSLSIPMLAFGAAAQPAQTPKVTYQDHVVPILRNTCFNCHNPDKKKGDLNLSFYAGAMAGGATKVIEPGDPDASKLIKLITWAEEPNMPPKGDKLPEKDVAVLRAWIAGALENSGSKAVAIKPKTNLAVVNSSAGKPSGPIAFPKDLPVEPVTTPRHNGALTALASSPWAPIIAVGGQKQIVLYHADTLETLGILPFPEGLAKSLRFSRNGSLLLAGGGVAAKNGKVIAYDVITGNRVAEVGDEFDEVLAADITPDQSTIALGTPLKTLKIYGTDGELKHTIKKHTDWVQAVAASPDGKYFASGDRAGGLWVVESKTGNEVHNCAGHREGVTDVCFRGDSLVLASASQDGTIRVWDMNEGKTVRTINAHPGGVLSIAFAHDGKLVSCGRDGTVKLWGADGAALKSFEKFNDLALRTTISHDGNRVVAGDYSGAIRVWNAADGARVGDLTANPAPVSARLAAIEKQMLDLGPAIEKANSDVKAAQAAVEMAAADVKAANDAVSAAQKASEKAAADLTAAKSQREQMPALKQAAEKAKADVAAAVAKLEQAKKAEKPDQEKIARYAGAVKKAQADAESAAKKVAGGDPTPAAKAAVEKAKADLEAAQKAVAAKTGAQKPAAEQLAKAQAAAKALADQLEGAKALKVKLAALVAKKK